MNTKDHDEAVLRAEVKCLVQALSPYRVLHRDALKRESGAENWHEAGFDRALRAAVADHLIEKLPLDFYRLPYAESESEANRHADGDGRNPAADARAS